MHRREQKREWMQKWAAKIYIHCECDESGESGVNHLLTVEACSYLLFLHTGLLNTAVCLTFILSLVFYIQLLQQNNDLYVSYLQWNSLKLNIKSIFTLFSCFAKMIWILDQAEKISTSCNWFCSFSDAHINQLVEVFWLYKLWRTLIWYSVYNSAILWFPVKLVGCLWISWCTDDSY